MSRAAALCGNGPWRLFITLHVCLQGGGLPGRPLILADHTTPTNIRQCCRQALWWCELPVRWPPTRRCGRSRRSCTSVAAPPAARGRRHTCTQACMHACAHACARPLSTTATPRWCRSAAACCMRAQAGRRPLLSGGAVVAREGAPAMEPACMLTFAATPEVDAVQAGTTAGAGAHACASVWERRSAKKALRREHKALARRAGGRQVGDGARPGGSGCCFRLDRSAQIRGVPGLG